jgi:hypothetical protein
MLEIGFFNSRRDVTKSQNVSCVPTSGSCLWKTGIQVGVSAIINIGRGETTSGKIVVKLVVFS